MQSSPVDLQSTPVDMQSSPVDTQSNPVDMQSSLANMQSSPVDMQSIPEEREALGYTVDTQPNSEVEGTYMSCKHASKCKGARDSSTRTHTRTNTHTHIHTLTWRHRARKDSPTGLMASTMWRWSRTRLMNAAHMASRVSATPCLLIHGLCGVRFV